MNQLHLLLLALFAADLHAVAKPCEQLKAEIAAKLEARGVREYQLEITNPGGAAGWTVVGSCDGGRHEILYRRGNVEIPEPLPEDPGTPPLIDDRAPRRPSDPMRPLP